MMKENRSHEIDNITTIQIIIDNNYSNITITQVIYFVNILIFLFLSIICILVFINIITQIFIIVINQFMDIFRLIGDFLHLFAVLILLLKILGNKNVIGVSYKTQEIYFFVFITRYSDMFL